MITAWDMDKYELLKKVPVSRSPIAHCADSVIEAMRSTSTKDEFIRFMKERGWKVKWDESLTFYNDKYEFKDSKIAESFHVQCTKEDLEKLFKINAPS